MVKGSLTYKICGDSNYLTHINPLLEKGQKVFVFKKQISVHKV